MTEKSLVCVVVLNWNGLPHVLRCLERVVASDYTPLSVIVVDNGSADGSLAAIQSGYPGVTLLSIPKNLGYAGGNNLGLREAIRSGAEYVLLLNNDTEIVRDMISILVATLKENERVGIASPKIFLAGSDRRLWAVGGVLRDHRVITWGINLVDSERNDFTELDFVFGCAMLVRRNVLDQIGLFDTGFDFYFEDIDLCLRAKQAGYEVVWVPDAITWHLNPIHTQGSSRFKIYNYERSRSYFYRKHTRQVGKFRFAISQIAHVLRIVGQSVGQGRLQRAYWGVTGMVAGLSVPANPTGKGENEQ
jgi:GT2 family glycosyltransferase